MLLSSLPTVFLDNYYAFCVSSRGILHVFSLSLAVPLCSTSIHNGPSNELCIFTQESQQPVSKINRKQDYFILSFSRQDRLMSFYLFNDSQIPLRSIIRQVKNSRFSFKDYSGVSLTKIALLFIPCNSTIQPESCTLCRRHKQHTHNMSDFFIFQDKSTVNNTIDFSHTLMKPPKTTTITTTTAMPNYSVDDFDVSSLQLSVMLYGNKEVKNDIEKTQLLMNSENCMVCNESIVRTKRSFGFCCCNSIDNLVITPQSLMPTSFSQDCSIECHLPPSLSICNSCLNSILCGNQSLSQSELTVSSSERKGWNLTSSQETIQRSLSTRTCGVSLSVLLAHIGHNVEDNSLDQDFKLTIYPWKIKEGKRPEAFRIYLQLTDMVMVWYDVLVKGIGL